MLGGGQAWENMGREGTERGLLRGRRWLLRTDRNVLKRFVLICTQVCHYTDAPPLTMGPPLPPLTMGPPLPPLMMGLPLINPP